MIQGRIGQTAKAALSGRAPLAQAMEGFLTTLEALWEVVRACAVWLRGMLLDNGSWTITTVPWPETLHALCPIMQYVPCGCCVQLPGSHRSSFVNKPPTQSASASALPCAGAPTDLWPTMSMMYGTDCGEYAGGLGGSKGARGGHGGQEGVKGSKRGPEGQSGQWGDEGARAAEGDRVAFASIEQVT